MFLRFSGYSGMDVGRDSGLVVDRAYAAKAPYAFTGTVHKVVFDLKPAARHEDGKTCTRLRPTERRHTASAPNRSSIPVPTSHDSEIRGECYEPEPSRS